MQRVQNRVQIRVLTGNATQVRAEASPPWQIVTNPSGLHASEAESRARIRGNVGVCVGVCLTSKLPRYVSMSDVVQPASDEALGPPLLSGVFNHPLKGCYSAVIRTLLKAGHRSMI